MKELNLDLIWNRVKNGKLDDSNKEVIEFLKVQDANDTEINKKETKVERI